jgi:hypothetical protein
MSKQLAEQQTEWDLHENQESFIPMEFTEEIKPDLFGLEATEAIEMVKGLSNTIAEREVLKNAYVDVIELPITTETLSVFKELRLKIVKNRTQGIEKWHTTNKAFYLAGGRFVDAVKNKESLVNTQMESKLLEAEKFFENQEKEKARLLNLDRIEKIRPYVEDADNMNFSEFDDQGFDDLILGKKTRFENEKKERESEALRIETNRLAEIERQNAIEAENAKLKAEAEEKEKALEKERAEAEAIRKAEADKQAKIQSEKDAEIAKLKVIENERLAKMESDKKEAEKLAKAPIKNQIEQWINNFEIPLPIVSNELTLEITQKFEAFKKWSLTQVNNL